MLKGILMENQCVQRSLNKDRGVLLKVVILFLWVIKDIVTENVCFGSFNRELSRIRSIQDINLGTFFCVSIWINLRTCSIIIRLINEVLQKVIILRNCIFFQLDNSWELIQIKKRPFIHKFIDCCWGEWDCSFWKLRLLGYSAQHLHVVYIFKSIFIY